MEHSQGTIYQRFLRRDRGIYNPLPLNNRHTSRQRGSKNQWEFLVRPVAKLGEFVNRTSEPVFFLRVFPAGYPRFQHEYVACRCLHYGYINPSMLTCADYWLNFYLNYNPSAIFPAFMSTHWVTSRFWWYGNWMSIPDLLICLVRIQLNH